MNWVVLLVPLHALFTILSAVDVRSPPLNATTDRVALLSLKSSLTGGNESVLASWNDTVGVCQWPGVICGGLHPDRVTALELPSFDLTGTISPSIANLSFLSYVYLSSNSLHGCISAEVGFLRRLRELDLRANMLQGSIPDTLSNCSRLQYLDLNENNLSGTIPRWIGNLTSLLELRLSDNGIEGSIPVELGLVPGIELVDLLFNQLSGEIPPSLFNLSFLHGLGLGGNFLSGSLPSDFGANLPNLSSLFLYSNQLQGSIPASLANASSLYDVQLGENMFAGIVPPSLGALPLLETLILDGNMLGNGGGPVGWSFVASLSSCVNLKMLDLTANDFSEPLPDSIGNLTIDLEWLRLGSNRLSGRIPAVIAGVENLLVLDLQDNQLSGTIPDVFGNFTKMEGLSVANNMLSGEIPPSMAHLTRLTELYMNNNNLSGGVPESLSAMENLVAFDISYNNLTDAVPKGVVGISSLTIFLNMSHNKLMGRLPCEVGKLANLKALDVSHNNFSGEIPSYLKSCLVLQHLYMQSNSFRGAIPEGLSYLKGLHILDLSRNRLSGQIPEFVKNLSSLQFLNLSFNNFEGEVPTGGIFGDPESFSIVGNENLCGGHPTLRLKPCPRERKRLSKAVVAIIAVAIVAILVILIPSCYLLLIPKRQRTGKWRVGPWPVFFSWKDRISNISYTDLQLATNNFSRANLIGTGGFGCIYKGCLKREGKAVAVKVFNTQLHASSKSFLAECRVLRCVRHRNLLTIITACSSWDSNGNEFKALVYDYMTNGGLHMWLHGDVGAQMGFDVYPLDVYQRLDIAIHVALALEYLHHQIETPIVHCDLKPSNVLLDASMTAHVGDFGIARVLSAGGETRTLGVRGSIGYVAPEYGMGSPANTLWDVYSFGVLLLEMFTGKGPTDESLVDDLSLHKYVENSFPERIEDIIDTNLFRGREGQMSQKVHDCLVVIMEIALICSNELAKERMQIKEALGQLELVRKSLRS